MILANCCYKQTAGRKVVHASPRHGSSLHAMVWRWVFVTSKLSYWPQRNFTEILRWKALVFCSQLPQSIMWIISPFIILHLQLPVIETPQLGWFMCVPVIWQILSQEYRSWQRLRWKTTVFEIDSCRFLRIMNCNGCHENTWYSSVICVSVRLFTKGINCALPCFFAFWKKRLAIG